MNIEALGRAERSMENMIGTKVKAFSFLLAVLVAVMLLAAKPAHAATFTVNSTADRADDSLGDGICATEPFQEGIEPECTLRAAIQEANTTAAADTINFRIGGSGVKTISPASSLPTITKPVTIDGYTEPGASKNTLAVGNNAELRVRLDGINTGIISRGISISTTNSVVRGLSITRFPGHAIDIAGAAADNNTIEGNFVGITPAGKDRGNGSGLSIRNGASGNTVGGKSPEARNVISGNGPSDQLSGTGVGISDAGTVKNKVMGNYIGTTKSGTGDLGNTGRGIFLGSSGNLIGDNDPSDGLTNAANTIAFNGLDGVDVSGTTSTGNRLLSNSIFSNAALGIRLGPNSHDGVGDADTGPNNLQNYPVISSAKTGRKATTIKGTLESSRNETFTLQFFKNPESTKEEGKKFIRRKTVTTDASGRASFTFKTRKVKAGLFVTATATRNSTGDTSEFSAPKKVRG